MRRTGRSSFVRSAIVALMLVLIVQGMASAATLAIDGQFGDWAGQPHTDDPAGDGHPNADVLSFYWGTNPGEDYIYWMMQRQSRDNPKVYYFVFLDANNNGSYTDAADRLVQVSYDPQKNSSDVVVTVLTGTGSQISQSSGDWGDSANEGGSRAEWRVSFADLGIDAHQTVNMYAGASHKQDPGDIDRLPDSGSITWTPIPVLGWPWLAAVVALVIGVAWLTRGRLIWRRPSS